MFKEFKPLSLRPTTRVDTSVIIYEVMLHSKKNLIKCSQDLNIITK